MCMTLDINNKYVTAAKAYFYLNWKWIQFTYYWLEIQLLISAAKIFLT